MVFSDWTGKGFPVVASPTLGRGCCRKGAALGCHGMAEDSLGSRGSLWDAYSTQSHTRSGCCAPRAKPDWTEQ